MSFCCCRYCRYLLSDFGLAGVEVGLEWMESFKLQLALAR